MDFFCVEHLLEVEVDGGIHANPNQAAYDAERTEWLETRGICVLRFSNEEVEGDLDGVLKRIVEATKASPLTPSPEVKKHTSEEGRAPREEELLPFS